MTEWTDERLNDSFDELRSDIRELREDMRGLRGEMGSLRDELHGEMNALRAKMDDGFTKLWITMAGGYATIVAAIIATN